MRKILALLIALVMTACVTTPTGEKKLSPEGQAVLAVSASIATRHFFEADPRAHEKAANVRAIIVKLKEVVPASASIKDLTTVASTEIDKLNITAVQKADAHDLLTLLSAVLEAKMGDAAIDPSKLVSVIDFLDTILSVLPSA